MRRACALAALQLCAASAPSAAIELSDGRYAMGTVLEITLETRDGDGGRALLARLYATAERLDRLLTLYEPTSQLVRLNAQAGKGPQAVDPDLARVLSESVAFAQRTRGSFDVTVGPLVALWRAAGERGAVPTPEELAQARSLVGVDGVRVASPTSAELVRAGAAVDLGGVAKGYALDRMAEQLRAAGAADALLSFGQSSLWALGAPPGHDGWRILVRRPEGGYAGVATLRDRAVSVSGSLGQWTEIAGRRYGHVIDPRSGRPLERAALAVVLAPTAAEAEALSKALLILGADEGLALLGSEPGREGLRVEADGSMHATSGWQAATRFEAERRP
jgi:thiamine biosynthesis lipoprotein